MKNIQHTQKKLRQIFVAFFCFLLVITIFIGQEAFFPSLKAHAVADGPGVPIQIPGYGQHSVGAYRTGNGVNVYCLEMPRIVDRSAPNPAFTTPNTIPGFQQSYYYAGDWQVTNANAPALQKGSANYNKLAYLLGVHGKTNDGVKAAALQIAIWEIRDIGATAGHRQLLNNYRSVLPANVKTLADALLAEATGWVAEGGTIGSLSGGYEPPAEPTLTASSAYKGTVRVAKDTTEIELSGGVFDSTGTSKMVWPSGVSNESTISWRSSHTEGWDRFKNLSVTGKWENPEGGISVGEIRYSPGITAPDGSITQAVGYGVSEKQVVNGKFQETKITLDTLWAPELSTKTPSEFVEVGQEFSDTVTFKASKEGNEWRRNTKNGVVSFAPVTARGVLYGPFQNDPSLNPQDDAPADAPIAGTATFTTTLEEGPGTYAVTPGIKAVASGYYSWVWSIDFNDQLDEVKNPPVSGEPAIAKEYFFSDRFGEALEGQTVPMTPALETVVDREIVRQNDPIIRDSVAAQIINGEWLNGSDGNPIPVNVRLDVYGSTREIVQQQRAPSDAEIIATGMVKIAGSGNATLSDPITIPEHAFTEYEAITIQACVFKEDQPEETRSFFNEVCDDYGVQSESAELEWIPELHTNVNTQFIDVGDDFNDTVSFHVRGLTVTESKERGWRKLKNGAGYEPVSAQGTLYGPFDVNPIFFAADTVPEHAKNRVAAAVGIVTDPELGPDTYEVKAPNALESGYYTWVWEIAAEGQTDYVRWSIPENYFFSDKFGSANETNTVSTTLELATVLNKNEITLLDLTVADTVRAGLLDGQWLMDSSGKRIPAVVRLTVYRGKGDLKRQTAAPTDETEAKIIASSQITVDKPETDFRSAKMQIPIREFLKHDYITVQACVLKEDQPEHLQGFLREVCDDFGVPSESAQLIKPAVTTKAQEQGALLGEIKDVATLTASDVPEGSTIEFTAFLKPETGAPKYDENWDLRLNDEGENVFWSAAEVADKEAVCEAQPVGKTAPVAAQKQGDYTSAAITAKSTGTIYWVEELFVPDPENPGAKISVHRGECGLANETTIVEKPEVTTKAKTNVKAGEKIYDVAIVKGPLADRAEISYEITFEAYHKNKDWAGKATEVCSAENKVWESQKPIKVLGEGQYRSEKWRTKPEHIGEIYWIETLWLVEQQDETQNRFAVHRGNCGEKDEITLVQEPVLAVTGSVQTGTIMGAVSVLMITAGIGIALRGRNRKHKEI